MIFSVFYTAEMKCVS